MALRTRCLVVVLSLFALSAPLALAQDPPAAPSDAPAQVAAISDLGMTPAPQAMGSAVDLSPMPEAACHGWITCPEPKSCNSNWSGFAPCDAPFCGWDSYCESKTPDGEATVQPKERFRSCTLGDGSICLEWQVYSFRLHCGCT